MKKIILLITVSIFFFSCQSTKSSKEIIRGIVADSNGEAACGSEIYINGEYKCSTDIYGHFAISGPIKENSVLSCKKDNFIETKTILDGKSENRMVYLTLENKALLFESSIKDVLEGEYEKALEKLKRIESHVTKENEKISVLYLKALIYKKTDNLDLFDECISSLESFSCDEESLLKLMNDF